MTSADHDQAVPEPAAAVVALLNSRSFAGMPDKLDAPDTAAPVLAPFDPSESMAADPSESVAVDPSGPAAVDPSVLPGSPETVTSHVPESRGPDAADLPTTELLELVRAVRDELVDLVEADNPPGWAAFAERVSPITFQQEFSGPGTVGLRQVTGDPVLGQITREVAALVGSGSWARLKFCANDECREVFYDTTRNRSRRWHAYGYCGNRANVAAYRARAAETD